MHPAPQLFALSAGLAGAAATFVGVGLGRFAYTPMIPAMVEGGWFSPPEAAYLGAVNLLGYLIGALAADRLAQRFGAARVVLIAFAAVTASFFLCAWPAPYHWFAGWRLAAGVGGAVLMVVGASTAITVVAPRQRARAGAFVFTGVGLGILASAVAVPFLLRAGVTAAWLGIAIAAALASATAWRRWTRMGRPATVPTTPRGDEAPLAAVASLAVAATLAAYAMEAVGFIPHTIFWVDYLAREQGLGVDTASMYWALLGLGATVGPLLSSELARRTGWQRGLSAALLLKATAVAIPLFTLSAVGLAVSSFVVGALVPGMVVLASGRLAELVGPAQHRRVWGYGTAAFASAQALAGYAYAALFGVTGSYWLHFVIATAALAVGAALAMAPGSASLPTRQATPTEE